MKSRSNKILPSSYKSLTNNILFFGLLYDSAQSYDIVTIKISFIVHDNEYKIHIKRFPSIIIYSQQSFIFSILK